MTDTSGGVVANAAVRIVDQATGIAYETLTNNAGEFVRPALKPSQYTVTVTAPGFKKSEQKDVLLTAGERTGLPITLSVGDVGQTVEVTAASPLLQTESTVVGANLNAKALSDLPLGGTRNLRLSRAPLSGGRAGRARRARRRQRRILRQRRPLQRPE